MIVKPIVRGFIGGALGTLAMRGYWKLVTKLTGDDPRQREAEGEGPLDDMSVIDMGRDDESSTAGFGRVIYEAATHRSPGPRKKKKLSKTVHWSYGILQGGLYGAATNLRKRGGLGSGALWGAAMWLLGDELAVPALGLSRGATAYPPSQHLHRLGAHVVYGLTLGAVNRALAP